MVGLFSIETFDDDSKALNVVIETPKGTRNKFKWDMKRKLFMLSGVLPAGAVFPFDFGFLPQTMGEDGDPLDILVLMDEPAFSGCLISGRLIGVIEVEQRERDGKSERNDRLVAVSEKSHTHASIKTLSDLDDTFVDQIEHFFVSYNQMMGKEFKPLRRRGTDPAMDLIEAGRKRAGRQKTKREQKSG